MASIRWDLLSDLGTVSESADWMDITLSARMVLDLDATYHRYQIPAAHSGLTFAGDALLHGHASGGKWPG